MASSDDVLRIILGQQYGQFEDQVKVDARSQLDKMSPETRAQIIAGLGKIPDMPDTGATPDAFKNGINGLVTALVTGGKGLTGTDLTAYHDALVALGKAGTNSELPDAKIADITAINQAAGQVNGEAAPKPPEPVAKPPQNPPPGGPNQTPPQAPPPSGSTVGNYDAIDPTKVTGFDHPDTKDKMQFEVDGQGCQEVHFDFDKSDVKSGTQMKACEDNFKLWQKASANNKDLYVYIDTHCDTMGSSPYNDALSNRRALAIRNEYVRLGIPANRIVMTGHGKNPPLEEAIPDQTVDAMDRSGSTSFGPPPATLYPGLTPQVATQQPGSGNLTTAAGTPGMIAGPDNALYYPNGMIIIGGAVLPGFRDRFFDFHHGDHDHDHDVARDDHDHSGPHEDRRDDHPRAPDDFHDHGPETMGQRFHDGKEKVEDVSHKAVDSGRRVIDKVEEKAHDFKESVHENGLGATLGAGTAAGAHSVVTGTHNFVEGFRNQYNSLKGQPSAPPPAAPPAAPPAGHPGSAGPSRGGMGR